METPKGYSLHIGINKIDPGHYAAIGLEPLRGAVKDAERMAEIANRFGFERVEIVCDQKATTHNLLAFLRDYADNLVAGDLFFMTYSGHGGRIEDQGYRSKGGDEPFDESWCLYDRQLIDDEIYEVFKSFKAGVRVVVFSDSCHSGTVTRVESPMIGTGLTLEGLQSKIDELIQEFNFRPKNLTPEQSNVLYDQNYDIYQAIQDKYRGVVKREDIKASVKLFAACQDNQYAFDGERNGFFTASILKLLRNTPIEALNSSQAFFQRLKLFYAYPTPNYFQYGAPNVAFDNQFPLQIAIPKQELITIKVAKDVDEEDVLIDIVNSRIASNSAIANEKFLERIVLTFSNSIEMRRYLMQLLPSKYVSIGFPEENVDNSCIININQLDYRSVWDAAYEILEKVDRENIHVEVEPLISQQLPKEAFQALTFRGQGTISFNFIRNLFRLSELQKNKIELLQKELILMLLKKPGKLKSIQNEELTTMELKRRIAIEFLENDDCSRLLTQFFQDRNKQI